MRILIVEDEPPTCAALQKILELEGHEVEVATSAADAAEHLQRSHYDLALIDYDLGAGLTGLDVGKLAPRNTALVMVTGYSPEEMRGKWEDPLTGFLAVIGKPLVVKALPDGSKRLLLLLIVDHVARSLENTRP